MCVYCHCYFDFWVRVKRPTLVKSLHFLLKFVEIEIDRCRLGVGTKHENCMFMNCLENVVEN